jgi:asparagine synthase (glutamine-hydrolysing)
MFGGGRPPAPPQNTPRKLQTFSIGFDDRAFDESPFARLAAQHIGSDHHEQTLSESMLLETLDAALDCLDEPIADSSILPTYLLSRVAAQHVKVVLGGDGGDELWAGYPTYKAHRYAELYARLPRRVRRNIVAPLVSRLPVRSGYQSLEWKAKRFALRWDDDPCVRHVRWMSNTDLADLARAIPGIEAEMPGPWQSAVGTNGCRDLNRILALDLATYLPGSVLTKVDRASMAHGLEVRPPMLDNALVDFAFSLPADVKLRGTRTKALLKRAAAGLLPQRLIHRRKRGFAIPLSRWLNGPLLPRVDRALGTSPLWETNILSREVFEGWFAEHRSRKCDRSKPLWALLVLDHWYHRVAEARGIEHQ